MPLGFCVAITMRRGGRQPLISRNAVGDSTSPSSWMISTALGSGAGVAGSPFATTNPASNIPATNKAARLKEGRIRFSRFLCGHLATVKRRGTFHYGSRTRLLKQSRLHFFLGKQLHGHR